MSIFFEESTRVFYLQTANILYQMKVDEQNILQHLYYGYPVGRTDMTYRSRFFDRGFSGNPYECREDRGYSLDLIGQEYTGSNNGDYRISSLELENHDGSRSADFRYVCHEISDKKYQILGMPSLREEKDMQTLRVTMQDPVTKLTLNLYYAVFEKRDIITRAAEIINTTGNTLILHKVSSLCIDYPYETFDLLHFHGRHCMERQLERTPLTHDIHVIGSKRGMSSHHHNPYVILCDHDATEESGSCYGFMLVYSGNHKTEIEVDQQGWTRLVMGIQDENFSWELRDGVNFFTPEVILSYSSKGLGQLSRNYHKILRENMCPPQFRDVQRPVLLNNWEATYFDFNEEKIHRLAAQAADLGVEMLVLDDGWFGVRNDDNTGLGDWFVNRDKLPGGLKGIADEVNRLGMKFGLWFEPEMISEDSDLFRAHPDWALTDPGRKPMMSRNQMVLDMSRQEVQDYLYDCISKILCEANIAYIKWDFNRSVANLFSQTIPAGRQGETAHRFILGTYALLDRLRTAFPQVMIEGCSGGGGRFDAGMLYYSPQIWCSDDTDAVARLRIQAGTSYGYPVSTMGSHVSICPNHQTGREASLNTRGIVAMSGTFGYELDLNKVSAEDKEIIREQIKTFHKYYWLIQKGEYYRLTDAFTNDYFTAWEFVSEDRSEALVNLVVTDVRANAPFPFFKCKGLQEDAIYTLEGTEEVYTGAALMYGGYALNILQGSYPGVQLHFIRK